MFAGLLSRNALWLLIIAVVAITRWSKKHQDEQLKSRARLRQREIEHRERMSELEVAIAKAHRSRP